MSSRRCRGCRITARTTIRARRASGRRRLVTALHHVHTPSQELAQLGRRVDSITRAAAAAGAAVIAYRKANPAKYDYSDSAVIADGRVKIYFNADFAKEARAGAAEAVHAQSLSLQLALDLGYRKRRSR